MHSEKSIRRTVSGAGQCCLFMRLCFFIRFEQRAGSETAGSRWKSLGDDDFIARMQKHAGLGSANPAAPARGHKANVSKIHTSAPTHDSDLKRYADKKFTNKDQRNQYA